MANRRTILRSLALAPLAPLGDLRAEFAALMTPDPALAAVEATKVALAAYSEAIPLTDQVVARNEGRIITPEDQATFDRASAAYENARVAMCETVPTSVQGIRAMLRWIIDNDPFADPETTAAIENILESPVLGGVGA